MRYSLINSASKPVREISERQLEILLSRVKTTLSWILGRLENIAASDGQVSDIFSELENVTTHLNELAERRFPASVKADQLDGISGTLKQIETSSRHQLTYCSPKMSAVINSVERAARRDVPILITGETGVGKELIARFIHISSRRNLGPLVPVNCAAIPRELFENQFFGHKQGAFTGALRDQAGVIRLAAGGTLFLDEIGELPLDLQPKLLRFLQEGEIFPLGDNLPSRVDVRVVASTNRNLEAEVNAGRFRADLLHRLNVITFEIPPLRERPEDIPVLLNFFLDKYSRLPGNYKVQFAPDTIDCLNAYDWAGNVRELSSLVLQMVSLAEEDTIIFPSDLPPCFKSHVEAFSASTRSSGDVAYLSEEAADESSNLKLGEAVSILERQRVYDALFKNNWNYSRAARQLGLSTYGLRKKYRRLFAEESTLSLKEH
jgi:hydrogenase-4 transcriptional activator